MKSTTLFLVASLTMLCAVETTAQDDVTHAKLTPLRWSGEVNIPDPVAISLDDQGAAYVTQTQRRKSQDLDIRNNRDWIPFDVGFRSVDEKAHFYQEQLSIEAGKSSASKRRVQDMNGDGLHDYRDLRVLSERIYRIQDRDGDGIADSKEIFAEQFQTEVTGIAAGVLAFGNSVYATIAPDVWRLSDENGDGRAERRQVVATGFGLHIAYAGHDMHGLTVGPDGRIYWTVGDKGISVVDQEGRRWHFPNQGGVMRCNPDGSNFEVFAHGLRNVQELAFDQFGNLFGVDNDADQPGERERFVYIVQNMDAGWRCNYQYRGNGYNPWTAEGLWKKPFEGQAAYILPPLGYSLNGPAGFAYNPGTALSPDYKDYFFLTGAPNGDQVAFRVEPKGAAFTRIDEHKIGRGLPLVGINFGPDGGLYAVDWGGGYPLNQKGAVWRFDVTDTEKDPRRPAVAELLRRGFSAYSDDELVGFLGFPDQRIRLHAQFQLVQRTAVDELTKVARSQQDLIARVHAIWGLGQLVRMGKADTHGLSDFLLSSEPQIQIQTCRLIREVEDFDSSEIVPLLTSENPHVVFHALMALAPHVTDEELPVVIDLLAGKGGEDDYLRHAAICVLENSQNLEPFFTHKHPNVRLAIVVALRRRQDERISRFLNDQNSFVVAEAVRGIHDDESIVASMGRLAKLAVDLETADPAVALRSVNANLRLGGTENANNLIRLASTANTRPEWRIAALGALADFLSPPVLDRVDGRNRHGEGPTLRHLPEDASFKLSALLLDDEVEVRRAALETMRHLKLPVDDSYLKELVLDGEAPLQLRLEAIAILENQGASELQTVANALSRDKEAKIRMAALEVISRTNENKAIKLVQQLLSDASTPQERQHAVLILGQVKTVVARPVLNDLVRQLEASTLPQEVLVELLEVVEGMKAPDPSWIQALENWKKSANVDPELEHIGEFVASQEGGNAAAGKKIFLTHVTAACVRCHQVGDQGNTVGPNLTRISDMKDARYLLRSIVSPSADIAPEYQTFVIQLLSGETIQGLLKSDDGTTTTLYDSTGKEVKIPNEEIDEAGPRTLSIMPEMKTVLSKREIRDLMAYLQTL